MRRLLRWTFHALAAASLLLCVATAGLWVRSYWVYDQLVGQRLEASELGRIGANHSECCIASDRGYFTGWFKWSERPEDQPTLPWTFKLVHPRSHFHWSWKLWFRVWFLADRDTRGWTEDARVWGVPDWMLVSAFAILPAIVALRHRGALRRRRAWLGCCPACGYDLRATPGRCPECGRQS